MIVCLLQSRGYITIAYRDVVDVEDILLARTGPVNFNVRVGIPGMLYATATDPIGSGIWTAPGAACRSSALSGESEAPKSTVFVVNCLTPPP